MLAFRRKMATNAAFTAITYIPIRPHILCKSDGTGGMPLATINQVIAVTNSYYLLNGFGIQFYFAGTTPDYIYNDQQYTSFNDENQLTQGHDVGNALNQYYVNSFASGVGGYAYYPDNAIYSTRSFILNESWNLDDMGNRLVPHELGHNFNLIHTYGNNNGGGGSTELVTRGAGANCLTDGDLVCDTPADPYNMPGANLIYDNNNCPSYDPNSTARDANGDPYAPSIPNIMSYYFPCTHLFSPGQYDRMQAALALRQSHTAYTLDAPPTAAPAPGNLTATTATGVVVLTWQDNATNEMGYFIERSTSPASGFLPIGGVGPNTTTFSDLKTNSNTLYYYRVKPSNTTNTGYSATLAVRAPICHPYFSVGCSSNDGLTNFTLNGSALSQNSGCSPTSYTSFTAAPTVTAGQSYTLTGTLLSAAWAEGVSIWVDLNRDGLFSQGEVVFQTFIPAGTSQFAGTLTLPARLTAGPVALRIVVNYNAIPADACGNYIYGETEDYQLLIINPADLSLSARTNTRLVALNQPISYSLTIRNDGPFTATGIQWQNLLSAGLLYVGGASSVIGSATSVASAASFSLAAGQSTTISYQLMATQPGTYLNAIQITNSDQFDPDSQPNSGTGDGQDDTATADFRTIPSSSSLYSSPNPNQTPLPAVIGNQPLPDPAKADLSLAMATSGHIGVLGSPITFTITVANAGGLSASNIVVRDTLQGLAFTASPSGMSVVGSTNGNAIVEGTIATLAANANTQLIFTATPTLPGSLKNVAQIWVSNTPDPDSKPGSLTPTANNLNGEDDIALIDLRIISP